jgi:hypothetical protein
MAEGEVCFDSLPKRCLGLQDCASVPRVLAQVL